MARPLAEHTPPRRERVLSLCAWTRLSDPRVPAAMTFEVETQAFVTEREAQCGAGQDS